MYAITPQATSSLNTCQMQSANLSFFGRMFDAIAGRLPPRLKWGPRESVTHQDQVLSNQRRKKPDRVARPQAKCCARRGDRTPGFFCIRLKRSPFSRGSVVHPERQRRQWSESPQPAVQDPIIKEAGQR